ncbi:hypothetical protein C2E21_0449 [Chlorella sorokiniana]|uniref:Uncharacterized protein n=1 Tax=Chlorella sorokiniana TaxID=3076 RepID=A0A2P6U3Q4_CHLSO|nr:hypothetical protein C2E21_0449 [Chlorella sorokiniana]|eukprot:PRW60945.1 hypothetical protein C2E21_0449 [Chlorella sorokiniana]
MRDVLEHRQPRLLHGRGLDNKEPIPSGATIPARFRPHTADGTPLRGPYKTRNGEGHNIGRQFFSTFRSRPRQFLWADGTEAFSSEALARNAAWAEDEGIVPDGMGPFAQLVQGLFGGASTVAFSSGGGWQEDWGDEEGWDEEDDRYEEASGYGEEFERESEEEEEELDEEAAEEDSEEEEEEEEEESSSGGE